jgi:hypothetical protein
MHIRFEGSIAGQNFAYQPGDVCEWPDENEAARFVAAGIATKLSPTEAAQVAASSGKTVRQHKPETATRTAPEKATTR